MLCCWTAVEWIVAAQGRACPDARACNVSRASQRLTSPWLPAAWLPAAWLPAAWLPAAITAGAVVGAPHLSLPAAALRWCAPPCQHWCLAGLHCCVGWYNGGQPCCIPRP